MLPKVGWKVKGKCQKLLEKAQRSKHNFDYSDLIKLAKCAGFEVDESHKGGGSHKILKRPFAPYTFNSQPGKNGKAKPAQISALLKAIAMTPEEDS